MFTLNFDAYLTAILWQITRACFSDFREKISSLHCANSLSITRGVVRECERGSTNDPHVTREAVRPQLRAGLHLSLPPQSPVTATTATNHCCQPAIATGQCSYNHQSLPKLSLATQGPDSTTTTIGQCHDRCHKTRPLHSTANIMLNTNACHLSQERLSPHAPAYVASHTCLYHVSQDQY